LEVNHQNDDTSGVTGTELGQVGCQQELFDHEAFGEHDFPILRTQVHRSIANAVDRAGKTRIARIFGTVPSAFGTIPTPYYRAAINQWCCLNKTSELK